MTAEQTDFCFSFNGIYSGKRPKEPNGRRLVDDRCQNERPDVAPYQVFEFRDNGKFVAMGIEVGTWDYAGGNILLNSKMNKNLTERCISSNRAPPDSFALVQKSNVETNPSVSIVIWTNNSRKKFVF